MPLGEQAPPGESSRKARGSARRKRVLSGMRPTGRLHIGHYFGALQNWVKLQDDPQYECFYFVADWHALTSDYADTSAIAQNTVEIATDFLASGLDPAKSVLFQQSQVPEHAELHLLLSMVTPLGWLERVPTYKEAMENIKDKDLHTYGFLGYPVLQTGDIVMYGEPRTELVVPVGEDQVSHVELTREIVRRFNEFYGFEVKDELFSENNAAVLEKVICILPSLGTQGAEGKNLEAVRNDRGLIRKYVAEMGLKNFFKELGKDKRFFRSVSVLREPDVMLTATPRIPGTDGRKMSKSYGNAITLSESDEDIRAKTKVMMTDPARKRRTDPGNPDVCPVFDWHKLFSSKETQEWSAQGCRTAGIGCIECKAAMADNLIRWIEPIRARRQELEAHPQRVWEILDDGSAKARRTAKRTMRRVREAVFDWDRARKSATDSAAATKPPAGGLAMKARPQGN